MEIASSNPFESFGAALRLFLHALLAALGLVSPKQAAEVRQFLEEFERAQAELETLFAQYQAGAFRTPAVRAADVDPCAVLIRRVFVRIFGRFWVCLILRDLCPLRAPDDLIFSKMGLGAA